jgi:predicted ribosome quality control (RQC) complex YloA/Tae2 family protein
MPFDSFVLGAVADEIRRAALPSQVVKIYQPSDFEAVFHLRAGGARLALLFSVHPERFRLHFARETPENPPSPPQFCMVLRKHLEGAKLVQVKQPGLERTLRLRFSRSDGERILIAEMMGKHSNLVLVDEGGMILDAIKHVSQRINRYRELLPNRLYSPPPPLAKPDPALTALPDLEAALRAAGDPLTPPKLMKAVANVGPLAAAEALARAESDRPEDAARGLFRLAERFRSGAFAPTLRLDSEGAPADAWAFEMKTIPADRQDLAPGMSLALEIADRSRSESAASDRLRGEILQRLAALAEREERKIAELGDAISQAEKADEFRIMGELIQANVHQIERGQTEASLPNYYDSELTPLRIELDPTLSPQENAEAYFRRQRKAKSGLPLLRRRREESESGLAWARALAREAGAAEEGRLREILAATERASPQERAPSSDASEAARRPAPGVRRAVSSDGYEIWYGENKEGNDTLTARLAAPTDFWLHVRAGTSAHVVIRSQKRPEQVPYRTIVEAARIAVAHSDSKHAGVTPVDYTLKKYVRKPRGSGVGTAFYTHEKTLHVESDDG